jgi:hypothetical protein
MPESDTSGSVRDRDGKPPSLLDLHYYREATSQGQPRNFAHYVAHDIARGRDSALLRGRAHRWHRRPPLRSLRAHGYLLRPSTHCEPLRDKRCRIPVCMCCDLARTALLRRRGAARGVLTTSSAERPPKLDMMPIARGPRIGPTGGSAARLTSVAERLQRDSIASQSHTV